MKDWFMNEILGYPQCPVCMRWIHVYQGDAKMNFCPNCGEKLNAVQFKKNTRNGEVIMQNESLT